jgi:hypothetical protein
MVAVLAVLAIGLAFSAEIVASEDEPIEREFNAGVTETLINIAKGMPAIWKVKRQAKKVAKKLPDYKGEVETPDSDLIYSWLEELCSWPHRRPGTPEGHAAEKWVKAKFNELGLEGVAMEPVPITVYTADKWSLVVDGKEIPSFFTVNTEFTGPEGITAPLVFVGEGTPAEFAEVDVKGKIVVADVPFPYLPTGLLLKGFRGSYLVSDPDKSIKFSTGQRLNFVRENFMGGFTAEGGEKPPQNDVYWNSHLKGAAAICLILRDQPSKYNTHYGPYDGIMKPMPGLWIGKYDGMKLRELAKAQKTATFTLTGTKKPGVMNNVWGTLPGMSDEVILVTSHHDAPFEGASEDGAGTVQVLAQAWAWSKVPKEQRPRTMVFVVDGGHFYGSKGALAFAREHKDIMKKTKICITLEHLAAKEVEEQDGEYAPTGDPALTVMFTTHDPVVLGAVIKAFKKKPPKRTVPIPSTFFGEAPTSDAAGYVIEGKVPIISWIGCPYYLLDSGDTLDKIDKSELQPIAETTAELVKVFMAMD